MYRLALMVVGLAVCLLPSFIAIYRNKRHKTAIVAVNLVFGALIASWVGLRVWGVLGSRAGRLGSGDDLEFVARREREKKAANGLLARARKSHLQEQEGNRWSRHWCW